MKEELNTSKPRHAIEELSENSGGIFGIEWSSALPQNVKQAYNIKQQLRKAPFQIPITLLYSSAKRKTRQKTLHMFER